MAFDANGDELVAINELIAGVGNALTGCPASPQPPPLPVWRGGAPASNGVTFR